jgi:hypothetical protein
MRIGSTSRSESGKRTNPCARGEARDASSSASTATIEDPTLLALSKNQDALTPTRSF